MKVKPQPSDSLSANLSVRFLVLTCFLTGFLSINSHSQGLEGVHVETYYVADEFDAMDSLSHGLESGTVTYRVWVDMKEGYKLLSVFGSPDHPLDFSTTTYFFNDTVNGKIEGADIEPAYLGRNPLMIDSYIAFSGTNRYDLGVMKVDDTDGSLLERTKVQSSYFPGDRGMLMASNPEAGIPIKVADGNMGGGVPSLILFGHDFSEFGNTLEADSVHVTNGAWAILNGLDGPFKDKNYLLIAQISTTGEFSYKLNLQLRSPDGITEYYVADNPVNEEVTHPELIYPPHSPSSKP